MARITGRHDRILLLIALFRFGKAALLIAAGCAAFELLRPGATQHVAQWVAEMPMETARSSPVAGTPAANKCQKASPRTSP